MRQVHEQVVRGEGSRPARRVGGQVGGSPDRPSHRREVPRPDGHSPCPDAQARLVVRRDFTLIIPAFNEAPVIPDLVKELRAAFERHQLDGEVILLDDGSTDGTADLAEAQTRDWDRFRVLRHRTNLGKTEAMLTAAEAAEEELLVLFDADLQHTPDEIPRFLEQLDGGWDVRSL